MDYGDYYWGLYRDYDPFQQPVPSYGLHPVCTDTTGAQGSLLVYVLYLVTEYVTRRIPKIQACAD